MKPLLYIIITVVLVGISFYTWAYIKVTKQEKELDSFEAFIGSNSIDSALQVFLTQFPINTQIAVAQIKEGKTFFYGYTKTENGVQITSNKNAVFEIGSITKTFTSALAAICIEQKLLTANTLLKDILPIKMKDDVGNISIEQLSNHTSGLPRLPKNLEMADPANPYADYDTTLLYNYLEKAVLENKSGTVYSYSNLGAGLLGVICAKKLHLTFDEALQKFIFEPLQMKQSSIAMPTNNLVKGQDADGNETSNWNFNCLGGAGEIKSTISNMALYANANINELPFLATCHTPTFKINEFMRIGMGLHIITTKTGNEYLFHNGGTGGYTSCMMIDKKEKKAIIVLTNISAYHPKMNLVDALCGKLMLK